MRIRNQLMFHSPPMALMPNAIEPAFRSTVCETVCQFCQPPVFGMLTVPYTCVPPAFSSCKLPPPLLPLATRYSTLYVPVLGILAGNVVFSDVFRSWFLETFLCVFPTRRLDTANVSATSCDDGFFFSVSYVVSLPNCRHVVDRLRYIR